MSVTRAWSPLLAASPNPVGARVGAAEAKGRGGVVLYVFRSPTSALHHGSTSKRLTLGARETWPIAVKEHT